MMKLVVKLSSTAVVFVVFLCCQLQSVMSIRGSLSPVPMDYCPPWFQFNASMNRCVCSTEGQPRVKCTDEGALLKIGSCMTFEKGSNITALGRCIYFQLDPTKHNITDQQFISLPSHLSDLNDYVCGPMNRQGLICSECIEGFAPSLTSIGYECSDCTNAWYGVPLYLFLELVPVTILYVIILVFKISLTSAPLTSFILFSQLAVYAITGIDAHTRNIMKLVSPTAYTVLISLTTLYSLFNLDFFRYVIPPFCVSPNLRSSHLVVLEYLSAYYPLLLIGITYCIVKINVRSSSCMRLKIIRSLFRSQRMLNIETSLIRVFASFLLLSYTKFMFAFTTFLGYAQVIGVNGSVVKRGLGIDPAITYFSGKHIPFVLFGTLSLILTLILSAFLLTLYPIRAFRSLLLRCRCGGHFKASLGIFIEQFHHCYRDGLDGGRDMRSFAGFHFLLRVLAFITAGGLPSHTYGISSWMVAYVLFIVSMLLIAAVKPFKEAYMNIVDILILANLSIVAATVHLFYVRSGFPDSVPLSLGQLLWIINIFVSFPILGLVFYIIANVFPKVKKSSMWMKIT